VQRALRVRNRRRPLNLLRLVPAKGVTMTSAAATKKSYRTIDLITIATLGVAFGVIYWGWGKVYGAPSEALGLIYPPLSGLTASPWLIAGVLGGLILRKPGAALATELVAAAVSTLVLGGTQWGWTV